MTNLTTPGFARRTKHYEAAVKYHREMIEVAASELIAVLSGDISEIDRRKALDNYTREAVREAKYLESRVERLFSGE